MDQFTVKEGKFGFGYDKSGMVIGLTSGEVHEAVNYSGLKLSK